MVLHLISMSKWVEDLGFMFSGYVEEEKGIMKKGF